MIKYFTIYETDIIKSHLEYKVKKYNLKIKETDDIAIKVDLSSVIGDTSSISDSNLPWIYPSQNTDIEMLPEKGDTVLVTFLNNWTMYYTSLIKKKDDESESKSRNVDIENKINISSTDEDKIEISVDKDVKLKINNADIEIDKSGKVNIISSENINISGNRLDLDGGTGDLSRPLSEFVICPFTGSPHQPVGTNPPNISTGMVPKLNKSIRKSLIESNVI